MSRFRQQSPIYLGTEWLNSVPSNKFLANGRGTIYNGDYGHYGYPRFGQRIVGGPFDISQTVVSPGLVDVGTVYFGGSPGNSAAQHYTGSMCADRYDPSGVATTNGSAFGAEAYNKMKPTKPVFNALNAVFELRELPHMLKGRMLDQGLKSIPNYWLALQFGWKPLLQDIRKMVASQRKAQDRLNWLLAHNGRPVRRRVVIAENVGEPQSFNVGYFGGGGLAPTLVTGYMAKSASGSVELTAGDRIWGSARFRYWLPEGPRDVEWKTKMLAYLFGLYPSPSVIYNALPWSWLADWFSNAGDVLENMDAGVADRCAADYVYVMRHHWARAQKSVTFALKGEGHGVKTFTSTTTVTNESKNRVPGDPFGFSTAQKDLSGMQLSILGALGLSRL